MSGREIGYRALRQARVLLEKIGPRAFTLPAPLARHTGAAWVATLPRGFETDKYRRAAEEVLDGRFAIFALQPAELGFPPQWNRDPRTGTRAPLRFGKSLDYRDVSLVGDIKYLWEPSRHAQPSRSHRPGT